MLEEVIHNDTSITPVNKKTGLFPQFLFIFMKRTPGKRLQILGVLYSYQ